MVAVFTIFLNLRSLFDFIVEYVVLSWMLVSCSTS